MTTQQQLRNERLKVGATTAGITGIFMLLVQTFPVWGPVVADLFKGSPEEPTPEQIDRDQSPDVDGNCNAVQGGSNNKMTGDVCSPKLSYQRNQTNYNSSQETNWDLSSTFNTEVNESSTNIFESTSLSYYSEINSWLVSQGLMAVMPYFAISQDDSSLTANVFLSNETNEVNLRKQVFAKKLEAGLRTGTIDPLLVEVLGYDPNELMPELIAFTPEEVEVLQPSIPDGRQVNAEPPVVKGNSKFEDCWKASILSTGSNHCKEGDHLF